LGTSLIEKYNNGNTEIIVLTRKKDCKKNNISYINWDGCTTGKWVKELEHSDAVVNLTGKSVNCRYTAKNKNEIIVSRVNATLAIGKAINQLQHPPKVWINAGSAAIFGNSGDEIKTESSLPGSGFSPEVCKQWEASFNSIDTPGTRKVFLRIGVVLQKNKGLLKPFIRLARVGLGGAIGSGEQYISWIHEKDFTNVADAVINCNDIEGIVHCSSPCPVKNNQFMKALRKACNIKIGLPAPAFITKPGAFLIGTEAALVLTGRRVLPKVLEERGFIFQYPRIEQAMEDLIVNKN